METLIRPAFTRHDFTGNDSPHMILSPDEVEEALAALDPADPDVSDKTKNLLSRIVPVDHITALWLVGPVEMNPAPVFSYDPVMAKYAHLQRMIAGEISTVELDALYAKIDQECAA